MPADQIFQITYWGVTGALSAPLRPDDVADKIARAVAALAERGQIRDLAPGPGLVDAVRRRLESLPFHLRSSYGGNTTCVEVQTPDALLILDCGSGFRELGIALEQRWNAPSYRGAREAHVLITHPHMDHTYGTPFMDAYFDARNQFTLWGPGTVLDSLRVLLDPRSPLSHTYFPPTFDLFTALRDMREIQPGSTFTIGSTTIRTYPLNHPGGCLAYRLENAGRSFVFATDHEHEEVPDLQLAEFARGADLFYADGQYLQDEYDGTAPVPQELTPRPRRGWGHSTIEACVATAVAAGVRILHVGHREPKRSDEQTTRFEEHLQKLLSAELRRAGRSADACQALIPYEGLSVRL
jgi:phosphoribosyl 1,2-cyclic phosphodiesterase